MKYEIFSFNRAQLVLQFMFVAEALFNFSSEVLKGAQKQDQENQPLYQHKQQPEQQQKQQLDKGKRKRSEQHDQELQIQGQGKYQKQEKSEQKVDTDQVKYLAFEAGEKILVQQAFETGWWYGNAIKRPDDSGFFPSNYVKVGAKPPPPAPSKRQEQKSENQQEEAFDPQEDGDWLSKKMNEANQTGQAPITSQYYQGIKSFKYVKINDNNKNLLKGNYVKFDVNTGLARVPVKDQAPAAKAVRQMGYYFDFHQWNEQRNKDPQAFKGKPDPTKKRKKKLRLLGMGKDA